MNCLRSRVFGKLPPANGRGKLPQTPFFRQYRLQPVRSRHRMRLSSWKIRLVIGYTGAATGTCFLLLAVGFAVYEASFLTRSSEAQGTVIANLGSQIGEPTQQTFCPQFQYESEDGGVQTITSSACSSPPTFSVGEKIHIHYLRSHPESGQSTLSPFPFHVRVQLSFAQDKQKGNVGLPEASTSSKGRSRIRLPLNQ
jgi:hypothetical protein